MDEGREGGREGRTDRWIEGGMDGWTDDRWTTDDGRTDE